MIKEQQRQEQFKAYWNDGSYFYFTTNVIYPEKAPEGLTPEILYNVMKKASEMFDEIGINAGYSVQFANKGIDANVK